MTDVPLITIIVPVKNMAASLPGCIESLLALDYPEDRKEVIIIDNGSSDGSRELAEKYKVRVLEESKPGSYAARNRGIKEARGEFIAFTDADCRVHPAWLSLLLGAFKSHRTASAGGMIMPHKGETIVELWQADRGVINNEKAQRDGVYKKAYSITANAMYPRNIFEKIGFFSEHSPSTCDAEMGWRIFEAGMEVKYVPEAIVYHHHRTSVSGVWEQFFRYGIGAASLFKYHNAGRKARIDINDKVSLFKALVKCITYPWPRKEDIGRWKPFLDAVQNTAFIAGKIMGSIRYRVIVI